MTHLSTLQRYCNDLHLNLGFSLARTTAGPPRRRRRQLGLTPDAASLGLGGRTYLRRIEQAVQPS